MVGKHFIRGSHILAIQINVVGLICLCCSDVLTGHGQDSNYKQLCGRVFGLFGGCFTVWRLLDLFGLCQAYARRPDVPGITPQPSVTLTF
jgi:hypothetical protein